MKLKLVKAAEEYKLQITKMLEEWYASGEKIIPYAIRKTDYHDFDNYCKNLKITDASSALVPDTTFFCLDEDRNIMVGAVNIRHYLNEALLLSGGHIGDGVRPSERKKGIATKMIGLALEECKLLGIDKVLMVCDKENIGSAKSIINNGGVLENEIEADGKILQRYWIVPNQKTSVSFFINKAAKRAYYDALKMYCFFSLSDKVDFSLRNRQTQPVKKQHKKTEKRKKVIQRSPEENFPD